MDKQNIVIPQKYTGVKKRTFEHLIHTALTILDEGNELTISELADKSKISRATAYRYFPTQSDLISAVVDYSLEPILRWQSDEQDLGKKINDFLSFAFTHMIKHEGAIRAAMRLSLQQWATERSTTSSKSEKFVRGNHKEVLSNLLQPLQSQLNDELNNKLIYTLSIIFGSQITVLKDVWNLEDSYIVSLSQWIIKAVINQAKQDASKL
ncbi:TetR/AcrR family transcriptional regulator [Gilliamella sp. B2776]|uniref:TetR/AcrR family transcriptional regulator n=1 Tax=unclassified Gilliamella TaxID=2685620 RepID=UPI002269EB3C|nr:MULTISPECIES: TetR/AcrR family transcriptional regulator [unclassified Gilliamella]MCX8649525.1 TetR/AcrR family transcriptional regulator [Gilliamella sp. B2779]MCX8654569.1 TetR/AcrR family transcriptional regulator [Gilliamella sp. B2737]MCX8656441.1 TetR/AcrR family transcriptional regulator [Gilliamella sp. B2894]MCX8664959.1 TetR/AcrR family transcriptional regulator [Gilliamella sp. B2887]MCX8692244.1 TetR/AcrR family transcriptional regulator [Gilliamella sp. B2776]